MSDTSKSRCIVRCVEFIESKNRRCFNFRRFQIVKDFDEAISILVTKLKKESLESLNKGKVAGLYFAIRTGLGSYDCRIYFVLTDGFYFTADTDLGLFVLKNMFPSNEQIIHEEFDGEEGTCVR